MEKTQLTDMMNRFLEAWNTQDVDKVAAWYSDNMIYIDPNTRNEIQSKKDFRRYLSRLFSVWNMRWVVRDVHPFGDINGAALRWHASFQKVGVDTWVEADGMDFVVLDGEQIKRNEVYFDRTALVSL